MLGILTCFCSHLCFCPSVVYQSHADRSLRPVWLSHVVMLVPLKQLAVFPRDSSEREMYCKKLLKVYHYAFTKHLPTNSPVLLTEDRCFKRS